MAGTGIDLEPWEPEESVGKLWHIFASRLHAPEQHDGAAVDLSEVSGRLAIFFRGLGGAPSVEIRPANAEISHHRLSFRRRLGVEAETLPRASFDGEALRLPARLAVFAERDANAALYLWLTAAAAHATPPVPAKDPLQADLQTIAQARDIRIATLAAAPGLAALHQRLSALILAARPRPALPRAEAAIEALIRHELGDRAPLPAPVRMMRDAVESQRAPGGYKRLNPVPLWPEIRDLQFSARTEGDSDIADGTTQEEGKGTHRARRRKSDQAERNDSLILHKFEAILSWAEFLNLNRRVDDDDPDAAKKALEDHDEIGLGQISKAPATRLKLHLDLAPEDVERERLSGLCTYPEWDARSACYLPAHARVLSSVAEECDTPAFREDPRAARRIRQVRRQFEALRPGRLTLPGCLDGDDLDIEAAVRAQTDIRTAGTGSDRIWRQTRPQARDLAVSILLDTSRSTESAVADRSVIEIEREALAALSWGLEACGDDFAIHAFSSLRRDRVYVRRCKAFDEPMSRRIEQRIGGLRPGFYTRMGAAIRHVSADLARQTRQRRLLLVITDGKPNDLDHYEGRHGIEDTAMAVREARRQGQSVFGVTIDQQAQSWFPRLFGRGGFHVIANAEKLTEALPRIYRQVVGA